MAKGFRIFPWRKDLSSATAFWGSVFGPTGARMATGIPYLVNKIRSDKLVFKLDASTLNIDALSELRQQKSGSGTSKLKNQNVFPAQSLEGI